jgi:hypothetical protein
MNRWRSLLTAGLFSLALTSSLVLAAPKASTPTLEPWERDFCVRIGGVAAMAARDRARGWTLDEVLRRLAVEEYRTGADTSIRNVFAEIAMEVYTLPVRSPESWQRIWTRVCQERMLATTGQR